MPVYGWELDAVEAVNRWPGWVGHPLEVAMQLGSRLAVVVVALLVAAAARRWRAAAAVLLAGALAWAGSGLLKEVVERDRPEPAGAEVVVRDHAPGYGFPSGHASIAAALAAVVPRRWRAAGVVLAVATAFGRMWVGVHLPLDVVGGLALGGVVGWVVRSSLPWPHGWEPA